jgi:hypothetical protein
VFAVISETNKDIFTSADNKEIVQAVITGEKPNITFDEGTNKFIGDQATYKSTYYDLYFLPKEKINFNVKEEKTVIVFDSEEVRIYYHSALVHKGDYTNENLESFNLLDVNSGNINSIRSFNKLLTVLLNDANGVFCVISLFTYITTMIFQYAAIVLMLFVFTMMYNPTIDKVVRLRLCCLDSLIFVFVFTFQIMLNMPWIIYLAAMLPVLYSNITFRHIVRKV